MVLLSVSQHLGIQVTVVDKFWGPQFIFSGPYFFKYFKSKYKVQKNMRITLKKIIIRGPKFGLSRAPKFLNPALPFILKLIFDLFKSV
jgi:hypothetical protein